MSNTLNQIRLILAAGLSVILFTQCSKSITGTEKTASRGNDATVKAVSNIPECVDCTDLESVQCGVYCGYVVDYHTEHVVNTESPSVAFADIVSNSFLSLPVNFEALSTEAGLPSTL